MSILEITHLTHAFGEQVLYKDASLRLNAGEHMGLTGLNGAGKSTLLKIITGKLLPDEGELSTAPRLRVGYLDQYAQVEMQQSMRAYLLSAYRMLYQTEQTLMQLYQRAAERQEDEESCLNRAARLQQQLESAGFYEREYQMERIARGLGIYELGLETPIEELSGGQRAKLILAKLLLEAPDILLMDEPTNFLDIEQIGWLEGYLQKYTGAFIIISHQQDFLEHVTSCISDLEFGKITTYRGSFSEAMRQKEFHREEQIRLHTSQQREIKKLEDYIARNKVRASTAAMAKSREKALAKIERIEAPQHLKVPSFSFPVREIPIQVILDVENLRIGYEKPLLPPITFRMKTGDKLAICGFNGVGKTTLLRTLMGQIPRLDGRFALQHAESISYYEQDLAWGDEEQTPLAYLTAVYPKKQPKELRSALSRAGVQSEHMLQSLKTLSGGEQSKVKLAQMSLRSSHLLVLDEPTNHLDQNAKLALIRAVRAYTGAVIVVSHERGFCEEITDRVIQLG